jgi:hypothetical protein
MATPGPGNPLMVSSRSVCPEVRVNPVPAPRPDPLISISGPFGLLSPANNRWLSPPTTMPAPVSSGRGVRGRIVKTPSAASVDGIWNETRHSTGSGLELHAALASRMA